jgi:transposase-like protein
MSEQRRRFSFQFKAEAVQMVIETGRPIAEVARDLGIHDGTLGNWVNAWRQANPDVADKRGRPGGSRRAVAHRGRNVSARSTASANLWGDRWLCSSRWASALPP